MPVYAALFGCPILPRWVLSLLRWTVNAFRLRTVTRFAFPFAVVPAGYCLRFRLHYRLVLPVAGYLRLPFGSYVCLFS